MSGPNRIASLLLAALLLAGCGGASGPVAAPEVNRSEVEIESLGVPDLGTTDTAPEPATVPAQPRQPRERKLVVLDPGHGGDEIGASTNGVAEKESNLDMALRVEKLLVERGVDVLLTRRGDARTAPQVPGLTASRSDLQARIDLANEAGADVFVSLHSNGSPDPSQRGVETWFDSSRAFGAENRRLAQLLQSHVVQELRAWGYAPVDRGLFDGVCWRQREGRCFGLFVLSGPRTISRTDVEGRGGDPEALGFSGGDSILTRPAQMPGALIELLIITNAADAAVLRHEGARQAMARGVADAIVEFLAARDGG